MDWCATVYWPPMREVFWGLIRTPPEKRNLELIETSRKKAAEVLTVLDAALAGRDSRDPAQAAQGTGLAQNGASELAELGK